MKTPTCPMTNAPATKAILAAAMILVLVSSGFAGVNQFSIGLNLGSDGGNNAGTGSLNPTDVAGLPAVAQANWNNLPGVSGSVVNVTDNGGNPTSAGAAWFSALGTWSSQGNNSFVSTTDHTLMQGYLDNAATATVTITNIPSQLTTSGYDVYVYALFDTPNRGGTYQIFDGLNTSTALTGLLPLNSDSSPTNYAQAVGTGSVKTGNYLVFRGLTNANIQLQAVATNLVGTIRATICGVQLVAAPSPGESGAATGLTVATNSQVGQLVVSWTAGGGSSGSLVVLRANVPETAQPVDGVVYNANPTFGSGDALSDDEIGYANYAVYAGASSSVVVSNLTPTLTYYAAVYPYNGSGASINYTLAKVATASGIVPGSPTNILLAIPSPLIAGSARNFQVLAQFANGAVQNVAASSTVTSSNNAIISILGPGRLGAVTSGTIGLTAVYSGFTNIQVVTVGSMSMTYDWSFNEPAANLSVTDSVQQAVGYVTNSPFSGPDGSGHLVLDGSAGFVALPPNIISNYGGLTIETWATATTPATWERLWDFGANTTINMFMSPVAGGTVLRTAFTVGGGGAEQRVNYPFSLDGARHQYVFTLNGATTTGKIFLDGVQVGTTTNFTLTPEDLGPLANMYIGKSQYADPYFAGSYDEFRIYNGPLSSMQIALDAATGPDVITNNPGALTSLTVFGNSPIPQFGIEQLSVTGIFANVSSPVNITSVEGIRYFTSDPNIGIVDGSGIFTATGPGTVQVRATLLGSGVTNSVFITVNQIPPGMTHRWPFNADFNDLLGGAPAIPHGTVALDGLGNAVLDGQGGNSTAGSYIELPPNLLLGYSSIVLEAWYTDECGDGTGVNRNWARLWDLGSGQNNNLFLTPFVGGQVDTMRCVLNTNASGEWTLNCVRPLTNVEHHIAFVIDSTNRLATFWVDGQLVSYNRNFLTRPRDMAQTGNDWLGRSQFPDPLFVGLIDEFRIYNGIIDPVQIGIDSVTGPNTLIQNPGALSTVALLLTTNMVAGYPQNASVTATFASVANVPVTTVATNWTSSDVTIARIDQNGRITAIGAGSALISATFRGVTANATVIVAAAPASPILAHRYSFDLGDARDTGVVGGGDGTVTGTPTFANGMVTIGDTGSYIGLPGHLFDTNLEVTLETWCVTAANSGSGTRMCDFGTSLTGPSAFGFCTSANGNNFIAFRTAIYSPLLPSINSWGRAAFGTTNHYAFVVSDLNRRVDIYFNGVLKDSFPYNDLPGTLQSGYIQYRYMLSYLTNNMTEGWFGKNVGGTVGSGWFGSIDEFRIWNGALDKAQVQVSFLKGPENPTIDPGAIQSLSMPLNDTTMVLGSIQKPVVSGTFANVGQSLDLTGLRGILFTSSDSSKVAVITSNSDSKLQAVGVGSANIVASYLGKSVTTTVTVVAKPQAVVTHRYSFRGNANDSVGHASGRLFGNAAISNNRLVLDGTLHPPTYARLPSDLISGYDQLTIEAFYSAPAGDSGSQQRLWDFGDHIIANATATGTGYFYEAAGRGAAGLPGNAPGGGEAAAIAPATDRASYTTNTTCVAATIDSPNHILNLYTNGALAMSVTNVVIDLNLVVDNFSLLGRSQWADPHFNGSIDDFRVYYGVLTPAQVAASFAAGPDPDSVHAVVAAPNQVTVFWPATLVTTGYSLQSANSLTSGLWSNVGGVTQVGGNYQVTVNSAGAPVYFRLIK
jgi:hypothetical protein